MSKTEKKKVIHTNKNEFVDRQIFENLSFPELTVRCETIDCTLLLLEAEEDLVLVGILKHMTDFIRRSNDNIALLKEKNVLERMKPMEYFRKSPNIMIRRFALYILSAIVESMNTLVDLETSKSMDLVEICLEYYKGEEDDFCLEYLSVVINQCLNDPQVVKIVLRDVKYKEIFNNLLINTTNPDIVLHSFQALEKMLRVQCLSGIQIFISEPTFPISRILCELTSEFVEIRTAALQVLRILVLETRSEGPFHKDAHIVQVLEQLTKMIFANYAPQELYLVLEVMAAAMRNEIITLAFFRHNHFENFMIYLNNTNMDKTTECISLMVLAEAANYNKFLPRLLGAAATEKLLSCLLEHTDAAPAPHILVGLNRMMKCPSVIHTIVETFSQGLVPTLLRLVGSTDVDIKTREQSALMLLNLLTNAFNVTALEMLDKKIENLISKILAQDPQHQSTDLILTLLNIIEGLADNCAFREQICQSEALTQNIATLLMNSFSTTILVNNIFRCLCTLVDEESVRGGLLKCYICSSIKRALQSLSVSVKSSVTNFIMLTARFKEFVQAYIDLGVLEVLILHQKHAFCVPTWSPAIDSILGKSPTLKFCIRNHLSFTDLTVGQDFFVSKSKFEDFRTFQCLLKDEVSPIQPVLVVNFDRPVTPEDKIMTVPIECLSLEECARQRDKGDWSYCRTPGDPQLPIYLEEVIINLKNAGLLQCPGRAKEGIDFANIAKRAKIISQVVARALGHDLSQLDLNATEELSKQAVKCHLKDLSRSFHCTFIPLGSLTTGCQFERAILFKALADQVGLPCTLQRSVDGRMLFNELPLPVEMERDMHCHKQTMAFLPWRMLSPTHIVDLMYNVGELYPIQSRQALQYLKLY